MKIERMNSTDYLIYDYSSVISEDTIYSDVKRIFQSIRKRILLKGFYRIVVCLKTMGLFLQVIKMEDAFYKDTLDLKIEVYPFDVYFCTEDYFLVKQCSSVYYCEGNYYGLVDDSFDKILEKVEFGSFCFGDKMNTIIRKSMIVQ